MKNRLFSSILLLSFTLIGCQTDNTAENSIGDNKGTILSVGLTKTRTVLGNQIDGIYPVYWSEGDRIVVDGEDIQWRFKPTTVQSDFVGRDYGYTTSQPAYTYRD